MKISVIIPTFNEASVIAQTIKEVGSRSAKENIEEILIVDGGSNDDTVDVAEMAGARVVMSDKQGRGLQLAHGAKRAKAELLYFLHADTLPSEGFDRAILKSIASGNKAGCFQLRFDRKERIFRIYGWFTRKRSIFCRGGDQSLFITKALYEELGGFNSEFRIFEDIDMIERIRKVARFDIIPKFVTTSARKYEENGFYRLQFYFAMMHIKYRFGASPEQLLQYYQRHVR